MTMATKTQFRLKGKSRDSYVELVLDFPLASIKSDEHLIEAQRVMDRRLARELILNTKLSPMDWATAVSLGVCPRNLQIS